MQITDIDVPGPAVGLTANEIRELSAELGQGIVPSTARGADGAGGDAAGGHAAPVNRVGSTAVPVRYYEPDIAPWATLVWAHGGSFVRGTLDWPEADWVARRFAEAGVRVYSVDYALASDTVKAPAPANDLAAVISWVAAQQEIDAAPLPLVTGGASAGAHLTVLATQALAGSAPRARHGAPGTAIATMLLLYPTLHRVQRENPALAARTRRLRPQRRFGADRIAEMVDIHLGGQVQTRTAGRTLIAGELSHDELAGLPPTVIVNADVDDLRTSAEQFAEQLEAAGVRVTSSLQPDTVHGYVNRPEESDRARADAAATIDTFVAELRAVLETCKAQA